MRSGCLTFLDVLSQVVKDHRFDDFFVTTRGESQRRDSLAHAEWLSSTDIIEKKKEPCDIL